LSVAVGGSIAAAFMAADSSHRRRRLRLGDRGDDVREVQIRVGGWARDADDLTAPAFLPINGVYGPETSESVRRFQQGYEIGRYDGEVGDATWDVLSRLARPDSSTAHFDWPELIRSDPGHQVTPEIHENARRLMYKLEALRRKLGDIEINVKAAYVTTATNPQETQIGDCAWHRFGAAVDITAFGAARPLWYRTALTCGFTGLGPIDRHWQHCDSRAEIPPTGLTAPWYASGAGN
jgi:peptidoglycan hydrolase-like protein with peptidoglycan-binding domain